MPNADPVVLPPPQGVSGAPFADPNLKLVVIDALLTAGLIDLGGLVHFLSQMLGRDYNPESDPQWLYKCQPAYDYLVRYPLSHAHLEAVDSICFDGGNEIYGYIWPGWDGESDDFNVGALGGIERLTGLKHFNDIAMLEAADFGPMQAMPNLQTLDLGSGTRISADVLLSLPSLNKFACYEDDAPDQGVLNKLTANGVKVRVY